MDNESSDAERSPFDPAPSAAKEPTDQRTRKKRSWLQSDAWNNAEQHSLVPDGSHWAVCGDLLARHDIEMVTAWKTGIQNQLIVVGHPLCKGLLMNVDNSRPYSLRSQPHS